jgi:hypothetical protein
MNAEQLPPRWREWPRHARVQFIIHNQTRRELFDLLADEAHLHRDEEIGDDPRLTKEELAKVYLALGGGQI